SYETGGCLDLSLVRRCPDRRGRPRAWRGTPRSSRGRSPASTRASLRPARPRSGGARQRCPCRNDRDEDRRPQWAERPNFCANCAYSLRRVAGELLINPRAGRARPDADELKAEAERRGIDARVLGEQDDVAEAARTARADVLGCAGGDGTVASAAAV